MGYDKQTDDVDLSEDVGLSDDLEIDSEQADGVKGGKAEVVKAPPVGPGVQSLHLG